MFTLAGIVAVSVSTLSTLAYFGIVEIEPTEVELPFGAGKFTVGFTEEKPLQLNLERE